LITQTVPVGRHKRSARNMAVNPGLRGQGERSHGRTAIQDGQMTDVFTVLAKDHEEVKGMLAELEKGPTRTTGASEDQRALRQKMTEQLIIEESRHEALEEMYFWPAVHEHHPAGDTLADEAAGQEQEAKEVLARLDKLGADDPGFETLLGTFTSAARVHIAFEETQVWPGLRLVLSAQTAAELGAAWTDWGAAGRGWASRGRACTPPDYRPDDRFARRGRTMRSWRPSPSKGPWFPCGWPHSLPPTRE